MYVANSKLKLHCMRKFFPTYELQYVHCQALAICVRGVRTYS